MAQDLPSQKSDDVFELLGRIVHDTEQLFDQHRELARSEFRQGLREVPTAAVSIAAGAGLLATGGVMGSLMLVHGLHRSTRVPLWGCYGLVGGLLATLGAGLLRSGTRRAAQIDLVPRETLAVLREDVQWIKDQTSRPPIAP